MLERIKPNIPSAASSAAPSSPNTAEVAKATALLFEVFAARFGTKWTRTYEDPLARRIWARDIENEGLEADDINRGLRVTRAAEWPPTVGEFIAACRPTAAELGVPEARDAYVGACRGIWMHPIAYHVAGQVGRYEMRTRSETSTWPAFDAAYKRALAEVRRGRVFEMPARHDRLLEAPPAPSAEEVERQKADFKEFVAAARAGRL
jgi:hypothetical protein